MYAIKKFLFRDVKFFVLVCFDVEKKTMSKEVNKDNVKTSKSLGKLQLMNLCQTTVNHSIEILDEKIH